MKDFDQSLLISIVFDLTTAHNTDGQRNIDVIKHILLKKVLDKNTLTKIYVSNREWLNLPKDQGASTYYLISYQEPIGFKIDYAFKQAVTMSGECREDCEKVVFLITDRFNAINHFQYRKGFLINDIRDYGLKICVFGLGANYDKSFLQSISQEYNADFYHLNDAYDLEKVITQIFDQGN